MRQGEYYIYFMASPTGTLYIGVTGDLEHRVWEHQHGILEGFSKQYRCIRLVYFEIFEYVQEAIAREKQLKNWNRAKKEKIICSLNPDWRDLSEDWKT